MKSVQKIINIDRAERRLNMNQEEKKLNFDKVGQNIGKSQVQVESLFRSRWTEAPFGVNSKYLIKTRLNRG